MKTLLLKNGFWSPFILFTCLLFSTITFGQATLVSDQPDYAPGATATFTGSGFEPGEQVIMLVLHYDGTPNTGTDHDSWVVTADEAGNFITTWHVCEDDCLGSTLIATADGLSSNLHAEVIFTDGTWTISSNSTVLCLNQSKELTMTLTTTGSPNNSSFSVNFPASFALSGLSITSVTAGKTWTSSLSGSTVCLTRTGGGSNALQSGESIVFKVTVLASATTGSPFSITGVSNIGTTPCPTTGTPQTTALGISVNNLTLNSSVTNVACFGGLTGSIDLTPSGGTSYSYAWTASNGGVIPVGQSNLQDLSGLNAGNYSVVVTDNNGCTSSITNIQVAQPATALSASETHVNVSCFGGSNGSINLIASGGTAPYSYAWSGSGVNASAEDQSGLSAGAYSVLITDANGCTSSANITLTEPTQLSASKVEGSIACYGGSTTVNILASGGTPPYVNDGSHTVYAGPYSFTVSDANGCEFEVSGNISEPTQLTASKVEGSIACYGGSTTVNIVASGGTPPYVNDGSHTVYVGPYSFTVSDANGCEFEVSGNISEPTQLTASKVEGSIACYGGSTTVNILASGGTPPYVNDGSHTVYAGPYSFTVSDANGCEFEVSGNISEPTQLSASKVEGSIACYGGSTTVNILASGGTPPYVNDGSHTVFAGPYSFTVSDANGCSIVVSGTVSQPSALSASCSSNNNSIYFGYSGDQSAIVTVNPSGGTGPYTVSLSMNRPLMCNQVTSSGDETWVPGAKTASSNAHVVCPGSGGAASNPSSTSLGTIVTGVGYSVTVSLMNDAVINALVTDSNGCTTTCSINIHAEDVRCFAGNSGVAKVQLCHKTGSAKNPCVAICVDNSAVAEHLAHGDFFGKCTPDCSPANANSKEEGLFNVIAYPNPSHSQFTLEIANGTEEFMNVEVFDMAGRLIKHIDNISNGKVTFGEELPRGVYLAVVNQGENSKTVRIVKED